MMLTYPWGSFLLRNEDSATINSTFISAVICHTVAIDTLIRLISYSHLIAFL